MPCRFASSGTVATSRSASRAILALNVASNFLRDLVISVLHRLRQSRTLHTLTFGPISGVHFRHDTQPAINVTVSCEQKIRPPTTAALLVKLGYNAKAEKRLAGLVYNFHPPFRTSFNWIVEVTKYFAGGFYRF